MESLRKLNDRLWPSYATFMGADKRAALGFIVRARSHDYAAGAAGALTRMGCEVADISKRSWPFGRRWQITAKGKPVVLDRPSVDAWSEGISAAVRDFDAVLAHWVPLL
jgi:hypothetical protein